MSILQTSDFIGQYQISQTVYGSLTSYIEKYEQYYLLRLFGAELYNLFVSDLTGSTPQVPQTQKYIDLFNEFSIDDGNCIRRSEGMKQMLIQFIYFQFIRDTNFEVTDSGVMRTASEVSSILPYNGFNLIESYNQAVENYNNIQWYICDKPLDYPEENVQHIGYTAGI